MYLQACQIQIKLSIGQSQYLENIYNGGDPLFLCQSTLKKSLHCITWRGRLRAQPQAVPELLGMSGDGSRSWPWLPGMDPEAAGVQGKHWSDITEKRGRNKEIKKGVKKGKIQD